MEKNLALAQAGNTAHLSWQQAFVVRAFSLAEARWKAELGEDLHGDPRRTIKRAIKRACYGK